MHRCEGDQSSKLAKLCTENDFVSSTPSTSQRSLTRIKSPRSKKLQNQTPTQTIIDDDDALDEIENKKPAESCEKIKLVSKDALCASYGRHRVQSVEPGQGQIKLKLKNLTNDESGNCILKGSWAETKIDQGDIVNILSVDSDMVIDDLNGLIVVNPDLLISGTSIVSTLFCMRKAVLSERFKGGEGSSRSMLVGTLVHMLLQETLRHGLRSKEDVAKQLDKCLEDGDVIKSLVSLGMSHQNMRTEMEPFLPHVLYFVEKYVLAKKGHVELPAPAFAGSNNQMNKTLAKPWPGTVEAIKDIEENIWSPRLGMKGKVDLTVQVKLQNRDAKGRMCKTLPLELKTGRPSGSAEHRGQLIMYSMMMSERRPDPESGLLLYLRTSSLQEVRAGIHEMRGLIQMRNQLAHHFLQDFEDLPSPINAKRACKECGLLNACAMYQKLADQVPPGPGHAMSELVPEVLNHLNEEDMNFFNHWSRLNSLESGEARKASRLKSLWCVTPQQRELQGQAIAGLTLCNDKCTLKKADNGKDLGASFSIFQPGDMVVVSSMAGELALAQGVVLELTHSSIKLSLDKEIISKNPLFVIDKFEFAQGSGNWLTLAKLMSNSAEASKLRKIVIQKAKASFVPGLPKEVAMLGKPVLKPLNRVQQKAVFKTMMAEDFVLLKGMPGSGKTTLIVALVRLLVKMGKTVLLTSYTHSAVDNLLLKLLEAESGSSCFLRLGRVSKIHAQIRDFSEDVLIKKQGIKDPCQLKELYQSQPVIAMTCLAANNHPYLAVKDKLFDYCIVDEAGQSLLLSALGPLFHARKFVLVGDPEQLPPVVKSAKAKSMGMDVSLFSHLQDEDNTLPLTVQYRMNSQIQKVANFMTYQGQLECGNDQVAEYQLDLSLDWPLFLPPEAKCESLAFFDTSNLDFMEAKDELGISNSGEAEFVARLAKFVVRQNQISLGIIAPFRAQVSVLRKLCSVPSCDISTVDQFQGRDKDVVIYSCTRTKPKRITETETEDIMSDWRRLNVAVTRAKCRLWMVGNTDVLKTYAPFAKLIDYLRSNDLIFKLQQL